MILGDYPDWRRALQFRLRSKDCAIARVVEPRFESFAGQNSTTMWWSLGDYRDWRRALQFRLRSKDYAIAQVVELKFSSPLGSRDPDKCRDSGA
jgi:hypothetical protein